MEHKNIDKYKILFVCLGNICRSPAAEGIMKKQIEEQGLEAVITVDSAGTSAYHKGELPDLRMRRYGLQRGYKLDSLSRKFILQDFDEYDIILAMDDNNYSDIMDIAPDIKSQKKVYRMTDFSSDKHYDYVPDPYYMGADGFELVLDILEDACTNLLASIKKKNL